jgi:2,4-dienoyl-CoA reductase-like NADH-dependent reductase (Old Yellow Enzyme family)
MAHLFSPLDLGPVRVENRIVVAPMCQYSANDGCASDWHLQHLMQLALSGAGLVVMEATGVERKGRITHGCLGLYSDANERALARVLAAARAVAPATTKFGIQIAHAGRKASAQLPWQGGQTLRSDEDPWRTVAPSPIPTAEGWPEPIALDEAAIEHTVLAFAATAKRAVRLGFDVIELHMAHGYLLHEFQSPLSNHRTDQWGGSPEKRAALLSEVARNVRAVLPAHIALGARITGTDWVNDGLGSNDAVALARNLKEIGVHYVDVSSGGIALKAPIPIKPGYQVPFAAKVRKETGILTRAVGMIVEPLQADDIIATGDADQVAMARAFLDNPRWPWHAAALLEAEIDRPPQYARSAPKLWPGAKLAHPTKVVA